MSTLSNQMLIYGSERIWLIELELVTNLVILNIEIILDYPGMPVSSHGPWTAIRKVEELEKDCKKGRRNEAEMAIRMIEAFERINSPLLV